MKRQRIAHYVWVVLMGCISTGPVWAESGGLNNLAPRRLQVPPSNFPSGSSLGQNLGEPPPPIEEEAAQAVQQQESTPQPAEVSAAPTAPKELRPAPEPNLITADGKLVENQPKSQRVQIGEAEEPDSDQIGLMPANEDFIADSAQTEGSMPMGVRSGRIVVPRRVVSRAPLSQLPAAPEVSVILVNDRFHPAVIRLKKDVATRLVFATTNKNAGALIIEQTEYQRWLRGIESTFDQQNKKLSHTWQITKEISDERVTIVELMPSSETYKFHDAITGATGEIIVEN